MFHRAQWIDFKYPIFMVGIFLIFIGASITYLKPHWTKKKGVISQLVALEKQLAAKQKTLGDYLFYEKQIDRLQKRFFFFRENPSPNSQLIYAIVAGQLLPEDVVTHSLTHQAVQREKGCCKTSVVVSTAGSYTAIIEYLYQMANLSYPVVLQHFRWHFADYLAGDQHRLNKRELSLLFHIYQVDPAPVDTQPHFWNSLALKPHRLASYSLNNMKMTGFLASTLTGKRWGLIKLLDAEDPIYKIEQGDTIGVEQAFVREINSEKIILQEKDSNKKRELSLENRNRPHDLSY